MYSHSQKLGQIHLCNSYCVTESIIIVQHLQGISQLITSRQKSHNFATAAAIPIYHILTGSLNISTKLCMRIAKTPTSYLSTYVKIVSPFTRSNTAHAHDVLGGVNSVHDRLFAHHQCTIETQNCGENRQKDKSFGVQTNLFGLSITLTRGSSFAPDFHFSLACVSA